MPLVPDLGFCDPLKRAHYLSLSYTGFSRVTLSFLCLSPGVSCFSKEPQFILVENGIKNQDLELDVLFAVEPCPWAWLGGVWVSLTGITSVCSGMCLHMPVCMLTLQWHPGPQHQSWSPFHMFCCLHACVAARCSFSSVSHLNHHCALSCPCLPALGLSLCIGSCPSPPHLIHSTLDMGTLQGDSALHGL